MKVPKAYLASVDVLQRSVGITNPRPRNLVTLVDRAPLATGSPLAVLIFADALAGNSLDDLARKVVIAMLRDVIPNALAGLFSDNLRVDPRTSCRIRRPKSPGSR